MGTCCKGLPGNDFLELGDGLRLAPTILHITPVWWGLSETCDVDQELHVTLLRAMLFLQESVWDVLREGRPFPWGILSIEIELHSSWRVPLLPSLPKTHLQHPQSHTWHLWKCWLAQWKYSTVADGARHWQGVRDVAFHFSLQKQFFPDASPLYPLKMYCFLMHILRWKSYAAFALLILLKREFLLLKSVWGVCKKNLT